MSVTLSSFFATSLSCFILFCKAKDANVNQTVPSSGGQRVSHVADANGASNTRVINIYIDREVPSWSDLEYMTRCAEKLDAQQCSAMLQDKRKSFMFDRRKVCRDTDIGA